MILADLKNKQVAFKDSTTLEDVKNLIDQLDQETLHELEVLPTEIKRYGHAWDWEYNKRIHDYIVENWGIKTKAEESITQDYTIQFV